ncbi:MAG: TIGR02584 family CRISPR-associated protein [Ottowia sp.]|nr:TIGR02584 family CRISPR-associated protein [Ottowia sp.]
MSNQSRPRSVLLAVTGMSPQVVTETLYALAIEENPFIPDEVHIITTVKGREKAIAGLLGDKQLEKLKKDYPLLAQVKFDESCIHVFHDADGEEIEEINTEEENFHVADTILERVRQFTRSDCSVLHVSLAGGYKQMSFYMGYIFSLFARPQDRLSHVLVNHPFDSQGSDFYFKPRKPCEITVRRGKEEETANTKDAVITLVPIPFVRLQVLSPQDKKSMLNDLLYGQDSYRDTVSAIQQSFEEPHLAIDLRAGRAFCGDVELKNLRPVSLAWLAWWAQQVLQETPLRGWSELANTPELREAFLTIYERVLQGNAARLSDTAQETLDKNRARLASGDDADCRTFFQENNSKLEKTLKEQLGPIVRHYLLATSGARPHTKHGLTTLKPSQIKLTGLD